MAVDKRIPRVLNSDADSKTINKVSMLDALNFYSGPDNEGFQNGVKSDSGEGVLKNIKGTQEVFIHEGEGLPSDARVIGSVEDVKTDITYFFVYAQNADDHGVWAYDKRDILNSFNGGAQQGPSIRLIYKSSQFNFPQNGFVKADIVYSNASKSTPPESGDEFDKDVIIYFTDGANEPRKINAYRAFFNSSGSQIHGVDPFAEADFITACPKVPLENISFYFDQDPERSVNNFSRSPGFQFAYQHIYLDGVESSISSYSDIAFPTVIIEQGAQTNIDDSLSNRCVLTIPGSGPEISKVRLLGRQGNTGSFMIIDELDASPESFSYNFYNDRILRGVSTDEVNKQFDSVPRKAKAQTTSSNRLMYANYTDGFDAVDVEAICTVNYKERPEDFIQYSVDYIPSKFGGGYSSYGQAQPSDNASFFLSFSELPDNLPAETNITFSISLQPQRNWHYYTAYGYQTIQRGPQPLGGNLGIHDGVNYQQSESLYGSADEYIGDTPVGAKIPELHVENEELSFTPQPAVEGKIWGGPVNDPTGVQVNQEVIWKRAFLPINSDNPTPPNVDQNQKAIFGTGAANPFIFQGQPITFTAQIKTTQDLTDARTKVCLAISEAICNPNVPPGYQFINECEGITLIEAQAEASYSFDLGLESGDLIDQHTIGQGESPLLHSDKICAVWGSDTSAISGVPTGYFIVNKGTPKFRLKRFFTEIQINPDEPNWGHMDSDYNEYLASIGVESPSHAYHFGISLAGLSDTEVHTCIHDTETDSPGTQAKPQWIVISADDIDYIHETGDLVGWFDSQNGYSFDDFAGFANKPSGVVHTQFAHGYQHQIGRLVFPAFEEDIISDQGPILSYLDLGFPNPYLWIVDSEYGDDFWPGAMSQKSLSDGAAGPGGGPAQGYATEGSLHPYDQLRMYAQGSVTVNPYYYLPDPSEVGSHRHKNTVFYGGSLTPTMASTIPNVEAGNFPTVLPFLKNKTTTEYVFTSSGIAEWLANPDFEYERPEGVQGAAIFNDYDNVYGFPSVDFKRNQSVVTPSVFNFLMTSSGELYGEGNESFKTKANHDFGIVYYDERGRHGFVNYLDSTYVKAYGERDAGEGYGAVSIDIKLLHDPPEWAHSYKIVYGGNSTVNDYIQYSVGGAFVGGDPDDQLVAESNKNIYVSLNYLQGHPVSYASSFGARNKEGGLNLYKFQEGDKLNVISYGPGSSRTYENHEFDVVGLVNLGDADNPLTSQELPEENQKGQFLVLKDNVNAVGFNHSAVAFEGTSNWEKNCIVEIRTPKKVLSPEEQIYYEASKSYRVVRDQYGNLSHEQVTVTLEKGDVWFRRVATNVKPLLNNEYLDIIPNDDGADPAPQPNFTTVYLEAESASDLFRSDSFSYKGRPNVVFDDEKETKRDATIIYSDASNPEGVKLNYSSFNASLAPFKDLSEQYGDIQYIVSYNDYIVVIQKEKLSIVPVNKNVISDASGSQQIIASLNVLGEVITYPGVSGCDDDPSSVYNSGDEIYFCNKSLSKVYRWSKSKGVEEISEKGMSSLIRASLKRAINVGQTRIVGGFDALKDEYLLSILVLDERDEPYGVTYPAQPGITPAFEGVDGGEDDTEGPSGEDGEGGTTGVQTEKLEVIPDLLTFGNVGVGQTQQQDVTLRATTNDPINVEAISFTNSRFSINPAQAFPIVLLPEFGFTSIPVTIFFNPDSVETFSGEINFTTNDPNQPTVTIDVEGSGVSVDEYTSSDAAVAFTEAYNDFYLTNISPEDMSAELAIDYLKDLKNDPNEGNHPTFNNLFGLLNEIDETLYAKFRFDYFGDGLIDTSDLLLFNTVFDTQYNTSGSIFVPQETTTAALPPPKVSVLPIFSSTQDAVDYLIAAGEMKVWEFYQYFSQSQVSDFRHLYNVNNVGSITITDFLQSLAVFGTEFLGSDSAFSSSYPGPTIENPEFSTSQVLGFIQQQHLSGADPMTVGQFYQLGQYLNPAMRLNGNAPSEYFSQGGATQEDGYNTTFQITAVDMLIFLSLLPSGVAGGTNDWTYNSNDPIFGL